MTQQQAPPRHNVAVIGFGVSPSRTPYLTCEPWFRTTQPFNIYLNDEEHRKLKFNVGDVITVERGGKGKDRQGNVKAGTADFDYYWNFIGMSGSQAPLAPQPNSQATGAATAPAPARVSSPASSPATAQGTSASSASPAPAPRYEADVKQWRTTHELNRVDAVNSAIAYTAKNGDWSFTEMMQLADSIFEYLESRQLPRYKGNTPEEQELPF